MDFATVLGLIIAVGAILGAFTIEGGNIAAIFMAGPILIVVGGTFGATMITTSMKTVFSLPTYLRLAFTGISLSTHSTIELIVETAVVKGELNSVDIDVEISDMAQNELLFTIGARLLQSKFDGIRKAITSR